MDQGIGFALHPAVAWLCAIPICVTPLALQVLALDDVATDLGPLEAPDVVEDVAQELVDKWQRHPDHKLH